MASNAVNLTDFMRALAQDPEVQRELRVMLFPGDLAGIQTAIRGLTESQQHTDAQLQTLTGTVRDLAEAQQRTELQVQALTEEMRAGVAALTQSLTEMEKRFTVRLGRLDGHYLEAKYLKLPYSFFGTLVHKAREVPLVDLADQLTGLDEEAFKDLLNLDLLVKGKLKEHPEKPDIWLAVEVSVVVDSHDLDRAERRAAALRKLGLRTIPVAAGEVATEGAIEQARDHGVLLLQDGRSRFWREALLAHPA